MDPTTDDKTPDPTAEPTAAATAAATAEPTAAATDLEGHSFGGAILGSAIAGSASRPHKPEQRPNDETLPPLTKPFPSMREQKPK